MRNKGFTFIELMAVILILGTLAMLVMPRIFGKIEEAKIVAAKVQIKSFENALKLFYLDNSFYPSTEQGLQALVSKPSSGRIPTNWKESGYLDKNYIPVDPWGHAYVYLSPGRHGEEYEIISYGRDNQEGGEGPDADISSSDIGKETAQ
jgi:general secretion pathway protein G